MDKNEIMRGETVLPDDYPVFYGYCYVADGVVITSDIEGSAKELKELRGIRELRRCNLAERGLL